MGLGMERKAVSCLSDPGSVLAQALVTGDCDMGLLAICAPLKPCDVQGSDPRSFRLAGDPGEVGVLPMVVGGREPPKEVQVHLLGQARIQVEEMVKGALVPSFPGASLCYWMTSSPLVLPLLTTASNDPLICAPRKPCWMRSLGTSWKVFFTHKGLYLLVILDPSFCKVYSRES